MARYSLIVREATYLALAQESVSTKKSMGKLLNEILDAHVNGIAKREPKQECAICGARGRILAFTKQGEKLFFCRGHIALAKVYGAYQELEE